MTPLRAFTAFVVWCVMSIVAATADPRQSPLFAGFELPKKPYCTKPSGDFAHGLDIRSALIALTRSYVQINPPWIVNALIFDIDANDGERRWHDRKLPMPRWNSINPRSGHAHTVFALSSPVLRDPKREQAPIRFLCAIEAAMRERIGGDPAYNGLLCKNPLYPGHRTVYGATSYSLDELAAYLPELDRQVAKPRINAEHYGFGRYVHTYDHARAYAYRAIREHWDGPLDAWAMHLAEWAENFTRLEHSAPLDRSETLHIGRSVGRWTWQRFTPATWSQRQSMLGKAGGIASGASRRRKNATRDAEIVALAEAGASQRAIADRYELSRNAVRNVLSRVGHEALYGESREKFEQPLKRRKRLPPGDLPETADMMAVEPLPARPAQSPGIVPQPADERDAEERKAEERRADAMRWINNIGVHAAKRSWPRKEPRPVGALLSIEAQVPRGTDDEIPFTLETDEVEDAPQSPYEVQDDDDVMPF